ncbi:uncharacterized protein LAJ45_11268 [Morchella importuna]|uniref:uncharacterized protein n=1 Tax=Morchella importuna TaxID=1174673 RepID=UPI001E8DD8C5|nr:uncharacterized protein LAJ45_11268 [Morchella importuna]KAH8144767.1 hypothetical protein LAJ45_11268 [Morchella importuna]
MSQPNPHPDPKLRVITTQAPAAPSLSPSRQTPFSPGTSSTVLLFSCTSTTQPSRQSTVLLGALTKPPLSPTAPLSASVCFKIEPRLGRWMIGMGKRYSSEKTEVRREVSTMVPPGEPAEAKGVGKLEGSMDESEVVDREKEVEDTRKEENGEQKKTEKEDSVEGDAEQQPRDHDQSEDVPNSEKTDEGDISSGQKSEPINSYGRNMDKVQDERQEKKTGTNGSDVHNTQSMAKMHLETKTERMDIKQDKVSQPQRIEQNANTCTSGIARLFCQSDVALTIPPEILTVEFVSVILHEDGRVET